MVCMNCLLATMAQFRKEGRSGNRTVIPGQTFYGAPVIRVIDADFNILVEEPWHDDLRLDYLIDVAQQVNGRATIAQDVYRFNGANKGKILDDGFEIQVYPEVAVREGNAYIPLEGIDHDHDEEVEEADAAALWDN